jgi:hypothetical protein
MDEAAITKYITDAFDGLDVVVASGVTFFFYDPGSTLPPDRRLPFATLMTIDDEYDRASDLNRPSVFRLNVGVGSDTYRSLFGPQPAPPGDTRVVDTGHDFSALDQILPHPVYAYMSWICVLNPSEATFEAVRPLLAEAYDLGVRRHARREARAQG